MKTGKFPGSSKTQRLKKSCILLSPSKSQTITVIFLLKCHAYSDPRFMTNKAGIESNCNNTRGQWKPRHASKRARQTLRKANNSVYVLLTTKQAIKLMHAARLSSQNKLARSSQSSQLMTLGFFSVKNEIKYYPETTETPKAHFIQTRKKRFGPRSPSQSKQPTHCN